MRRVLLLTLALLILSVVGFVLAEPQTAAEKARQEELSRLPPYKRLLTGEDAKRAAELDKKMAELEEGDKYAEAIQVAEELLDLRRRVQGADHHESVNTKWEIDERRKVAALPAERRAAWRGGARGKTQAQQLIQRGRYREARPLLEKRLDLCRQVLGEEHPVTAASNSYLGYVAGLLGQLTEAEALHRKALHHSRQTLGEDHPNTAAGYGNVAWILTKRGKYVEAERLFRTALDINVRVLGEWHGETGGSHLNLAMSLSGQERYNEAESLGRRALEISRRAFGETHPQTAQSYSDLASSLNEQGKYSEAELLHQNALDIRRTMFGEAHPKMADSYHGLAYSVNSQGKHSEAERLLRIALSIRQKTLGEMHPDTAGSYNGLAVILDAQGKYAEAEPFFRMALNIRQKALGETHRDTVRIHNNLAYNLDAQGRHAEAEHGHRKALEMWRQALGDNHSTTAISYDNLGLNLNAQGKHADAEPLQRKALEVFRRSLGEMHGDTAKSYNNVAGSMNAQGKHADAEPFYRRGLEISRQALGDIHPYTAICYTNVAANLNAQGRYAEAEPFARTALANLEAARLRATASGLDRAGAQRIVPRLYWAVALLHTGRPTEAWQALEGHFGRGLLDDYSARHGLKLPPEDQRKKDQINAKLVMFDKQISDLFNRKGGLEEHRKEFEQLAGQRKKVQDALAQLSAELNQREIYDLKRIQQYLPENAALVYWLDIAGNPKAPNPNGEHWGFILRPAGDPVVVKLSGSAKDGVWTEEDNELPDQMRAALTDWANPSLAGDLARRLSDQRLAPLEPHLKDVQHLIALPSSAMRGIPLEVLTDRFVVSYAPSGTMYARLQEDKAKSAANSSGKPTRLLALGDPVFLERATPPVEPPPPDHGAYIAQIVPNSNAAKSGLKQHDVILSYGGNKLAKPAELTTIMQKVSQAGGKEPIPVRVWREGQTLDVTVAPGPLGIQRAEQPAAEMITSKRESDKLLRSVGQDYYPRLEGSRREVEALGRLFSSPTLLLGSEASEQNLDRLASSGELRQFRYLHFATHGEMNRRIAMHSALILAQDKLPDTLEQILDGKEVIYDGKVTAEQIMQTWKLDADLVTLSACQTGIADKFSGGEGYLGFSQALFYAGARSVVLSLWKVDDRATSLLMVRFYENLLGKRPGTKPMSKAVALKEAKEWLRTRSAAEIDQQLASLPRGTIGTASKSDKPATPPRSYEHPYYWAGFILIGDPE